MQLNKRNPEVRRGNLFQTFRCYLHNPQEKALLQRTFPRPQEPTNSLSTTSFYAQKLYDSNHLIKPNGYPPPTKLHKPNQFSNQTSPLTEALHRQIVQKDSKSKENQEIYNIAQDTGPPLHQTLFPSNFRPTEKIERNNIQENTSNNTKLHWVRFYLNNCATKHTEAKITSKPPPLAVHNTQAETPPFTEHIQ